MPLDSDPSARELRETLSFWQVTVSGIGIVIGAGIYVLIGPATAEAGAT
jgi:amino acid transporter